MSENRFSSNGTPPPEVPSVSERGRKVDATLSQRFDILNKHLKEVEGHLKKLRPPA